MYITAGDKVDFNDSFYIDLVPGKEVKFSENLEYANKLMKLFESYTTSEEIRKA